MVKEIFATLQGEGANAGRAAVFCRFARCNLWSGREEHRASAICRFCDTDFVGTDGPGGGTFATADALADAVAATWPGGPSAGWRRRRRGWSCAPAASRCCSSTTRWSTRCTTGGFEVAIETNGTLPPPAGIDWVCVSPKAGAELVVRDRRRAEAGLPPAPEPSPSASVDLDFTHHFLQPMDGPDRVANTDAAVAYCLAHPRWRLSLQTHKLIGIP